MRFAPFVLMLSLLALLGLAPATRAQAPLPSSKAVHWLASKPMVFSNASKHLSLGDSLSQVEDELGPWPDPNNPLHAFPDRLVVRLDDGHVVMLTAGGTPCPWVLKVDEAEACKLGDRLSDLRARLGAPKLRFGKELNDTDGKSGVFWIYYAALGDAGLLFVDNELQSILLTEPGRLETILPTAGYVRLPN
jgi:hypothetical protein